MPQPKGSTARSAAAKKAAATRKANAERAAREERRRRAKDVEDRVKSIGIFLFGLFLAINEFFIEPKPREGGILFICACWTLQLATYVDARKRDRDS